MLLQYMQGHGVSAGCTVEGTAPSQGDVRLVNLRGNNFTTQSCDEVHFGGVEIFNDGEWGRVCTGFSERAGFAVDAKVVCRQLGFPFGSLMDVQEAQLGRGYSVDYSAYDQPVELVWATAVDCTGKEERLDECFLPEDFGAAVEVYAYAYGFYDYAGQEQDPQGTLSPGPAAAQTGPRGIPNADCSRRDGDTLAVACRRFEIEGARLHNFCLVNADTEYNTTYECAAAVSHVLVHPDV